MNLMTRVKNARRFWRKVERGGSDECWPWTGARHHRDGTGVTKVDGRAVAAHRFSWELAHGPIPVGGSIVRTCGSRSCVNPVHLALVGRVMQPADTNVSQSSNSQTGGLGGPPARLPGRLSKDPLAKERQAALELLIEVEATFVAQRDRIDLRVMRENASGSADRTLYRELGVALKLLEAHAKMELELGLRGALTR